MMEGEYRFLCHRQSVSIMHTLPRLKSNLTHAPVNYMLLLSWGFSDGFEQPIRQRFLICHVCNCEQVSECLRGGVKIQRPQYIRPFIDSFHTSGFAAHN